MFASTEQDDLSSSSSDDSTTGYESDGSSQASEKYVSPDAKKNLFKINKTSPASHRRMYSKYFKITTKHYSGEPLNNMTLGEVKILYNNWVTDVQLLNDVLGENEIPKIKIHTVVDLPIQWQFLRLVGLYKKKASIVYKTRSNGELFREKFASSIGRMKNFVPILGFANLDIYFDVLTAPLKYVAKLYTEVSGMNLTYPDEARFDDTMQ